jgi:hypothetical protein
MFSRLRPAIVALVLVLASVSTGFAQQPDSLSAKGSAARPGRAAVGAQVGGSWVLAEGDYSDGAQPRFAFEGSYRYIISKGLRWQVSPYFSWNAYRTGTDLPFVDPVFTADGLKKDAVITQLVGANAQLQFVHGSGGTLWHVGVGPSVYRVVVQNHRKVLRDPATDRLHKGAYLGGTAELGVERFLKSLPNTSLEWTIAGQAAWAKRDEQFPSGFNGLVGAAEFRFGAHYYFDFRAPKKTVKAPARKR